MSDPFISTGSIEFRPCPMCKASIEHKESIGVHGGNSIWWPASHSGPCGKPCIAAGVKATDFRAGNVHRDGCLFCEQAKP